MQHIRAGDAVLSDTGVTKENNGWSFDGRCLSSLSDLGSTGREWNPSERRDLCHFRPTIAVLLVMPLYGDPVCPVSGATTNIYRSPLISYKVVEGNDIQVSQSNVFEGSSG